jgi:RND family efflux transporter MFP subunit
MRKIKLLNILLLLIVSSSFSGCAKAPFMAGMQGGGVPVTATILKSSNVADSAIYQGTLISRYSVSLQPQVAGQISGIFVKPGDRVKAGQLLMQIDSRKQLAAFNSTRSDSQVANAAIYQSKSQLNNLLMQRDALQSSYNFNKTMYDRYKSLYSLKSVSQQDYEKYSDSFNKAKSDLAANKAQIDAQKAVIKAAYSAYNRTIANINEQRVLLNFYSIVAPYGGVIGDIPFKIGNQVNVSDKLISITQNNNLEINTALPVDKVFQIKKGLPVEILDNSGNVVGQSKISFVSPNVDTSTQTVLVKANISNPQEIFKADQSVKVRVIYSSKSGITVPTTAVLNFGGQSFAYKIITKGKMNIVKQIPVKIGALQSDKYAVLSGLKEDDKIVSSGIQKLMDGVPVMILPEGSK